MKKFVAFLLSNFFLTFAAMAQNAVVVDSLTRLPLANATILDCHGTAIGLSGRNGRMPYIAENSFPVTVRYLGYKEKTVLDAAAKIIELSESISELPEVLVATRQQKVFHMLAYVREYSTLTTYSDTVFLFREKMVDYMLPSDRKAKFRGWTNPRVLTSKSYYRFMNSADLDSVSDESNYHFSWSDWIGVAPAAGMPARLRSADAGTDTIMGKYSPTETWTKADYRVNVDVNVLADTTSRKWVPNLAGFFRNDLDFENFRLRFNFDNVTDDTVSAMDLTGYSFNIESNGRGHNMFRFNRVDEPFFVSTYAEVYMLDKEYITVKEARKWESRRFSSNEIGVIASPEAPPLQTSVLELMARVDNVEKEKVRLGVQPDERLAGMYAGKGNFGFGHRFLTLLKDLTGITTVKAHRNMNNQWKKFRKEHIRKNNIGTIRRDDDEAHESE